MQSLSNVKRWRKEASSLIARLNADYRNHRMLCDPWRRAVHSMIQGWRNIESQGRLGYRPATRRSPTTWTEAVNEIKASLDAKKQSRLLDQTTWQFWARQIRPPSTRYIPKRWRPQIAPEAPSIPRTFCNCWNGKATVAP
jgi:hypothetical protein